MDARIPQAAEEVLSAAIKPRIEDCFDTDPVVPRNAWLSALALACFWKALHDPTPVDEAWLRSVGFSETANDYWLGVMGDRLCLARNKSDGHWKIEPTTEQEWEDGVNIPSPETRGQLRDLCRLLGVPLKESTP